MAAFAVPIDWSLRGGWTRSQSGGCPAEYSYSSLFTSKRLLNTKNAKRCRRAKNHLQQQGLRCTMSESSIIRSFEASDFEIRRIIGQQSFATITDWTYYTPAPFAETRTTEPSSPAIRLYDARIVGSLPGLYNTRVMLKEFLPPALELGVTEAEAYNAIYACVVPGSDVAALPVASLMGSFQTDESFESYEFKISWRARFPKSPQPPEPRAPFLVFRFEGLTTPLRLVATRRDKDTVDGNEWFDSLFPNNLYRRKAIYIRTFIAKCIAALYFLHTKAGLVHRSIGLASILVNTVQWQYASSLEVKLKDFGFAKRTSQLAEGKDLERARKNEAFTPSQISAFYFAEDIYALGYALLELIFSVYAKQPITQDTFKKLFEDTFDFNVEAARDFCAQDPSWTDAVAFLDTTGRSGWDLIFSMLRARKNYSKVSLERLAESPFLQSKF